MKKIFLLVTIICLGAAQGKNSTITIGQNTSLESTILNEDRKLQIHTPKYYEPNGTKNYPVIYLLDGDSHFLHTVGIVEFLSSQNRMPESIIVSIPNTDRRRDFTTTPRTPEKYYPTAGGADNFLTFIEKELIPFINNEYKTNNHRTLIGHSMGGLFTVHTLINRPNLFSNYIAISPGLWWDNNGILSKTESFLDKNISLKNRLYMTIGNEGGKYFKSVNNLSIIFKEKAPKTLEWKFKHMPGESHGSIPLRTIYDGLEKIYQGWDFGDIFTLLRNEDIQSVDMHFNKLSKKYGFYIETPADVIERFGYRFLRNKKFDRAIEMYSRNVKTNPNSAGAHYTLGQAYEKSNKIKLAYTSFKKAVELAEMKSDPELDTYTINFNRLGRRLDN